MTTFTHLHLHTQYSILDGACKIEPLMHKAKEDGMTAIAITDHGNMFGVLEFVEKAKKAGIKPIIGCEVYVAHNNRHSKTTKDDRSGHHLILLAKNLKGYHNLSKLVSFGYTEGFYYTPRIDKEILKKYSEGLIATSACLGGEIPSAILRYGEDKAAEVLEEYISIFGEDFYLELMRHGLEDQDVVNEVLINLAGKYNVHLIATNDVHYINKEDFDAHHILVCLNTGKDVNDTDTLSYSGNEYFKTTAEMMETFYNIPEAISNTQHIVNKVEAFEIFREVILPLFPLPEGFSDSDSYLEYLVEEGAKSKYPELTEEINQRLDYELSVIKKMGFSGYFLIVQDFINAARKMEVIVGPGRGSAAGSAVAYVIGITNIDPIRYNLMFERFLNPERISMPDMDIDFDDYGRDKVIRYVVDKYGQDKVAHIITFGSMAARSAIRDVARVLKLPLHESDRLAKQVPEDPGTTLDKAFSSVPSLKKELDEGSELVRKTLKFAQTLEGITRHTGIHACGMIIGNDNLLNNIPICTSKDTDLMVTQYEGSKIENVGMLKMDFLGLKTLTIIRDTIDNLRKNKEIEIDIDKIPYDDEATLDIYRLGHTIGTFQFESEGMRTYLKALKPNSIDDLIAMNALFRPGPMQQIPVYIQRKHGHEPVNYPHPLLEEILKPTYGILIYQEQIIQVVQIIAGLSPGKADLFRRAIGKKKAEEIAKMRITFLEGAEKIHIEKNKAEYIYELIEKFANYGFNKSHAAAYSVVAFQTAYLKAHHPANYMAAVLAHNMGDLNKLNQLISECNRMELEVKGPDINESDYKFTVNNERIIRFGLGAIKGVGEAAVESLISEREANGPYKDFFDLVIRVNPRAVNKKCLEALACAGAFDSFQGSHRAQYFHLEPNADQSIIDKAIRFGQKIREMKNSVQQSLFGDNEMEHINIPVLPECEPWPLLELFNKEKEFIGYYISGHPLDDYKADLQHIADFTIEEFNDKLQELSGKHIYVGGMVTSFTEKFSKTGDAFGNIIIEDYTSNLRISLFKEKYLKFKHLLNPGTKLLLRLAVAPRYQNPNELYPDISEAYLLSEVRTKFFKKITILIDLSDLNQALREKLEKLVKKHPGNCKLYFDFTYTNGNNSMIQLSMTPEKLMINPSNQFFHDLETIDNISYRVN